MSETKTPMPKGRPPKHMNVILKSTLNQPAEKAPEQEIINPVPSEVEQKPALVPEKKPRTEAQVAATKRMLEAKGKRSITIHEPKPEPKPEPKVEPKVEPKPEVKEQPDVYKMLQSMEERLAKMTEPKPKVAKPKKEKVKEAPKAPAKPKPQPKPKQYDSEDESEPESDDEYVSKYQRKAEKRFQAVQQIEQRLQAVKKPVGRYDHLSLF
jgi:hypothetical protein